MFSLGSSHRYFLYRDACDGTHEITLGYRFGEGALRSRLL